MRIRLTLLTILLPACALAQPNVWTPKVEFNLEGASPNETLTWVSGFGYALTEAGRKKAGGICLGSNEVVDSKVLLDALNGKFKGQRITSEQAAPVLYAAATSRYKCRK